jgi:hypothetical protein
MSSFIPVLIYQKIFVLKKTASMPQGISKVAQTFPRPRWGRD